MKKFHNCFKLYIIYIFHRRQKISYFLNILTKYTKKKKSSKIKKKSMNFFLIEMNKIIVKIYFKNSLLILQFMRKKIKIQ